MPELDARHDFAHPVEGDEAWSESYYFNAYDPDTDTGFFTRIGVRPNEGTIDVGLSVWLPGTEIAQTRAVREQHEMIDTGLEVGGVCYERLEPLRRWRITADADAFVRDLSGDGTRTTRLGVDVCFDALTPAFGVDGQGGAGAGASRATSASVAKGHLEQAGRWSGTISADGVSHELRAARGNRDKSWGPRRWGGPTMWRWFSVNVGDDTHLGGVLIGTESGDLHRGWSWSEGRHASIAEWSVRTELADDGISHRVSHVRALDKSGRAFDLRGDVLRVAPHRTDRDGRVTVVNEGLARWELDGRTGYGIAEYLHQLDADGRPVVPIR